MGEVEVGYKGSRACEEDLSYYSPGRGDSAWMGNYSEEKETIPRSIP